MTESAEERVATMTQRRCPHEDGPIPAWQCDKCWSAEIRAAESAARAEGKDEGVREERRRGREKLNRFKSKLRARSEFLEKDTKTYAEGIRIGQERMKARCKSAIGALLNMVRALEVEDE